MWIKRLARLGYGAKAVVYALVGILAIISGPSDKSDAFSVIIRQPFGRFLLAVIAAGLAGYAAWRLICGLRDTERRGSSAKALAIRGGSAARGLGYGWIAFEVARLAMENGGGTGGDAQARHWTARAMARPFGEVAVILVSAGVIAYALYQLYRAVTGKLSRHLHIPRGPLRAISRFGLAARAIVFLIIGSSFVIAVLRENPEEAHATSGALGELASAPFGGAMLKVIGAGLIAYAVYAFLNAIYRRISTA
jgi:hypothetical protein